RISGLTLAGREVHLLGCEEQTVAGQARVKARYHVLAGLLDLAEDREGGTHSRVGVRLIVRVRRPQTDQLVTCRVEVPVHSRERVLVLPLAAALRDGTGGESDPAIRLTRALRLHQDEG